MDMSMVLLERRDEVALLIFNRPERLNAVNIEFMDVLKARVQEVRADASIRAVVITGEGRAFCAGADLSPEEQAKIQSSPRLKESDRDRIDPVSNWPERWLGLTIPVPVVCAINGAAAGYGAEMALTADMRIAGESGRIGWVFARRGLVTDQCVGPVLLPRIVGFSQTARLLFSGEVINATEMLRIGLVDEVVADSALRERAVALARHLASGAPEAVAWHKKQIYNTLLQDPHAMYVENKAVFSASMKSEDFAEGVNAFREKREPRWTGR